ncbi:MAG: 2-amino-4-hydroxy-6-hydroxymethyldihydropteridine diphosphokinase [Thiohalomonadaceae bacterium]
MFTRCYIGLGSNLQNPEAQIDQALNALALVPDSRLTAVSSLYRSAPLGPSDQPDYLNAVAMFDTRLAALALLDALQAIEQQQGRVRERHWGPRTIDLDLLLYGAEQIDLPRLQVPHPQMLLRSFVLVPLVELAPELRLPDGSGLQQALLDGDRTGLVKLRPLRLS